MSRTAKSLRLAPLALAALSASCRTAAPMQPQPPVPQQSDATTQPIEAMTNIDLATVNVPDADPAAAWLPEGYKAEIAVRGLTCPTSVDVDENGNLYVAEAGGMEGDAAAPARVIRVTPDGGTTIVAENLSAPVNDILWHEGQLYISHRGRISMVGQNGQLRDLVKNLPSFGDHQNNQLAAGPDGKIYFGQGTATNSGVVGLDNFMMGWLKQRPDLHDVPGRDILLTTWQWITIDPLAMATGDAAAATTEPASDVANPSVPLVPTGPLNSFGQGAAPGGYIRGSIKGNGTILRMDADGANLEQYAWGLRNPFGLAWSKDGRLVASDDGFDDRGSRPIANASDALWDIKQNAWYGWPDFSAGEPVTLAKFAPKNGPTPTFLMLNHPDLAQPMGTRPPHTGVAKLDVAPASFGFEGQLFLAETGDFAPLTGDEPTESHGYDVVRVDPATGKADVFFKTKDEALGSLLEHTQHIATAGPRRPVDVRFSPKGDALYVADLGAIAVQAGAAPGPKPFAGTGVIWRVVKDGATVSGPTNVSVAQAAPATEPMTQPATEPAPVPPAPTTTESKSAISPAEQPAQAEAAGQAAPTPTQPSTPTQPATPPPTEELNK